MPAEFKIARLRYNYLGQWDIDTFYNRDAVVTYEGKTYVCLEPHTSGNNNSTFYDALYNQTVDGGDAPYWNLLISGRKWVGDWAPSTYYSLDNIVLFGGALYVCNEQHNSGVTINLAKFDIYATAAKWHPAWTTATSYGEGDVVKYGAIVYICNTNHTSAATNALGLEASSANWDILISGVEYTGTWSSAGYRYRTNDIVKYGPDIWISNSGHVSTNTFDQTKWSVWIPGQEYVDSWNVGTIYQPGDAIMYGGYSYVSKTANNTGNTPSTSTTNWELLTVGYDLQNEWSQSNNYKVGNVVRKSGMLYSALQDNSGQDPTVISMSKIYNDAGSSGTILKLDNTSSLIVGMTLIGPGFTLGQSVVRVIDANTIQLSQAPDAVLASGQTILFVGINYIYWDLVIPGVNWKNFWEADTAYAIGDIVILKNITYKCVQTHVSSIITGDKPDLDSTHLYWINYAVHARNNALTNQGDILSLAEQETLGFAIGETDQVLQATTTNGHILPAWKQILVTPKVYYVAETGEDRDDYGITWDRPWKTIQYATGKVDAGTENIGIKQCMEANKLFLTTEMYQWMLYQKANTISPFSPSSMFDPDKTVRDAGYIIDALVYDLTRLGNSQTVLAAKAFFKLEGEGSFINADVAAQIPFFIAALNRLKTLILSNVLLGSVPTTLYQEVNGVNPGDIIEMQIGFQVGFIDAVAPLIDIVINALTAASVYDIPPSNIGISSTIMVKTGTYSEALPIVVPEYTAIVGDELRGVTVQPKLVINTFTESSTAGTSIPASTTITGAVDHSEWSFVGGTVSLKATTLPYHSFGNAADPNTPTDQAVNKTWPWRGGTDLEATNKVATTVGNIGYWINGVNMYNPSAAGGAPGGYTAIPGFNYNASFASATELGYTFGEDEAGGHAAPGGMYHYHDYSFSTAWTTGDGYVSGIVGSTGTAELNTIPYLAGSLTHGDGHSKILGISLDGYPVYGPFGYTTPTSATSGVKIMATGYALKDASYRVGTPAANMSLYPMGIFIQDYEFIGQGDLDISNGRYCVTPDYPNGTYAYFVTIDETLLTPVYPYVLGNVYHSTPASMLPTVSTSGTGGGYPPLGLGIINSGGKFTVYSTEGMFDECKVQFVSKSSFITNLDPFETATITAGQTYYVIGDTLTSTTLQISEVPGGTPVALTGDAGFMQIVGGDALEDMFRCRNAVGLRNLTLKGLLGTLTPLNEYLTQRPTGGAFACLDPGTGPTDTKSWIKNRSPYTQNLSMFGSGCVGMKVDGTLHNGGNKSMTANDFTCIISDGIGAWITGNDSKAELVSVFTYYNYTGYFAENGGRVRAANGNCSYGTYGAIAEGYDINEDPITATIDNQTTQATASVQQAYGGDASLLKLQYNNAGVNYTQATTNLLNYSNNFIASGWNTDGNLTIQQNLISPSGFNDGWTINGITSNTDSAYIYRDITIPPTGAIYTGLSGSNETGSGSAATFDVTVNATSYSVIVSTTGTGGTGYVFGNKITIYGSQVGGIDGVNDITLTVASLVGSTIITVTPTGTVPAGSALRYTFSVYAKQATAPSFDLYAIYSGYGPSSTRTSYVSFNFNTKILTAGNGGDSGLTPETGYYGVDYLTNDWYRIWFAVYDTNALNNNVRFQIYPRSRLGATGSTSLYGGQVEVGNSPGFYLTTTTNQYTSYADYIISGAGTGTIIVADELRGDSVYQSRITDPGSGAGGKGYLTASNNAGGGNESYITLAAADINTAANYNGMRVFINSGTGAGQFGFIADFNFDSKIAWVLKESIIPLSVTSAATSDDNFTLSAGSDVYSLYLDQPVQFIPTYYSTSATQTSQLSFAVLSITGGVVNTMAVANTAILYYNMAITFSGTVSGGVVENFTYYVSEIIDENYFRISSTSFGSTLLLSTLTPSGMFLDIPSNSSYLTVASTSGMAPNMPIQFTGSSLGGITLGDIYYINDIVSPTTLTISGQLLSPTITASDSATSRLTVGSTSTLVALNPIVFSEPTIGGLLASTKYYISKISNSTQFRVSDSLLTVQVSATAFGSNLITCSSTSGFVADNPIKFTGNSFGGIVAETTYFILAVNDANTFTVAATVGASAITLQTASGFMTARTCPVAVELISDAGSMTAKTTTSKTILSTSRGLMNVIFSTPVFGGVVQGTTYYIKSITPGAPDNKISITATPSGTTFNLTSGSGTMEMGELGWDHVNPGTVIEPALDSTSLYYIEPRLNYSAPSFSQSAQVLPSAGVGTTYATIAYGGNYWIAVPDGNTTIIGSSNGSVWESFTLPTTAADWSSIAYGNKAWVLISSTNDKVLYSFSNGQSWKKSTMPSSDNWTSISYGNGRFVALASGTTKAAYSTTYGSTWNSATLPGANATWSNIASGAGKFVTVAALSTRSAYSTDSGTTWQESVLPGAATAAWASVAYGNGRFVAVGVNSVKPASSFNGIDWVESKYAINASLVTYGNGVFLALNSGSSVAWISEDGIFWKRKQVTSDTYGAAAFGFTATANNGRFVTVAGTISGSTIIAGATTKGRPIVDSGIITSVTEFETGGGYSPTPATISLFDPNVTTVASISPRIGNGVLSAPTFISRGQGYNTSSTAVKINGDGYADTYQIGLAISISNLTQLPRPGDDLTITGDDIIYKVTNATILNGTTAPNLTASIQISPPMSVALSPDHATDLIIREKYSQVRLTNHDFLNVGYGNQADSGYPGFPEETTLQAQNQTIENNYGRVFYTSTDQDGNFKVGNLFGVEQATGIVTLSASQFGLSGLDKLSLGGIAVGGSSVVVSQFSTDATFVANSDTVIPTQKAVKSYLSARLSQGGSNTFTGNTTAGTVTIGGPNVINNTIPQGTPGSSIEMINKVMFDGVDGGLIDGGLMALDFFMKNATKR